MIDVLVFGMLRMCYKSVIKVGTCMHKLGGI